LSRTDLMRIEAEDILASRVFDDEGDGDVVALEESSDETDG